MNNLLFILFVGTAYWWYPPTVNADTTFCTNTVILDKNNKIIPWYLPHEQAYDHFIHLRWDFVKHHVPYSPGPIPRNRLL